MIAIKYISLEDAFQYDYSLFSVLAFPQTWQEDAVYRMPERGRPDSGLMYITSCENTMLVGKERINAGIGQIVYLPMSTVYEAHFKNTLNENGKSENTTNYLLNFIIKDSLGEALNFSDKIRVITPNDSKKMLIMFREICEKGCNAKVPSAIMKAEAYKLITELSKQLLQKNNNQSESLIAKATDYIGERCLHENVEISRLCEMLHVSPSTLRRLFVKSVGMSPKEYINSLRLKRAKLLIENGGVDICEVARLCGFEDASYFSRFFKKHIGKSPTEF